MCGVSIESNLANMCAPCLSTEVDITDGISKECSLVQCNGCLRFQRSTGAKGTSGIYAECPLESLDLMALCLKKIHGLNKDVKLIDASFIWTEPHSKRIKLKLTIRKEAMRNAILQKSFIVTFIVENLKCTDCSKQYNNSTWKAVVQIRQKVHHKRTFFHLEQIILKHGAHTRAIGMTAEKDGMDFFFNEKNSAERFAQFLSQHVPTRSKSARKLISSDNHNNTANVKLTVHVELAPICKDDLVIVDKRLAQLCGSNLVLVTRVTTQVHILDPLTGRRAEIPSDRYWKTPFEALDSASSMVDYVVLNVELVDEPRRHRPSTASDVALVGPDDVMAVVEVARVSDLGVNDMTFSVMTHLGRFLSAGDFVKGYDLGRCNFGSQQLYHLQADLPDLVLVRRVYPKKDSGDQKKSKKGTRRKSMMARSGKAKDIEREEAEYEAFMDDYEEDDEAQDVGRQEVGGDDEEGSAAATE
ncbi:hypothetical protein DYB25_012907 [Aphanomyces astaci]|uniref:60S ribosomal export protein NMD3 n=4 Tax=Aphanomyces astaci TaxID=112090 RepID=A0A397DVK2_APHAT|nr:hypothetical protein DYB25_012907 [Aphanomyces astaci]RHY68149.1 hypothetical protein DYB30_001629 [Aphanomyces astaci]RHZ01861.1 hypothetical protein DYB26_011929 [Aphanomyces astaci]RHZ07534.1 hypothetical protein DYB31_012148 [Aphanomyces astaci]